MSRVTDTIGIVEIKLDRAEIASRVEKHLRKKGPIPLKLTLEFTDSVKLTQLLKEPWPIVVRFLP